MHQSKIQAIRNILGEGEAALITSNSNRFYFTGFRSSAGSLYITPQDAYFFVDFRYYEKAKKNIHHCKVILANKAYRQIKEIDPSIKKIYVETDSTTIAQFQKLREAFSDFEISEKNKLDDAILKLRRIKTVQEIESIKKAQKITDQTFSHILNYISAGKSEKEIMLEMEFFLRKQGSEGVSFEFIVVSGKNSSYPHGRPTDKLLEAGDFITMDFGAVIDGYRSDMTRTVALDHVTEDQQKVYNTVLEAQLAALNLIKPSAICKDIDHAARSLIYSAGYEGCFGHGLGHSVGIDVHEGPSFNTSDESLLEPGMVLTVEPGIYLEDRFGVRIEDMVVITNDGFENITKSPKDLIIL